MINNSDNSTDSLVEDNMNNLFMKAHYMPRPRIDKIFEQAADCKLIYVVASAGYGKTQTVRNYIEQQEEAVVRWVQLTEGDNIPSRFWEHFTYNILSDNPELSAKLCDLGFPYTLTCFKQFAEIVKNTEHRSHKTFLILDDFHLIHSKQVLTFTERAAYLKIPELCIIIISRKEPEINTVSLFAKGKAGVITEDELRFAEDEIDEFLKFRGVPFSKKFLPEFFDATKGWALAIQFLPLVLKRVPENIDFALSTMKQNIYKLFEMEAFGDFPEDIQKMLAKLALISYLPSALLRDVESVASFIQSNSQMASFIWFDSLSGDYRVHPLYLEFLQSKHQILSCEEKLDTYRQAAQWCFENNLYMDAMRYFAKSNQFERMLQILFSYPFRLPQDTCEYFLSILESLEPLKNEKLSREENVSFQLLKNYFIPLILRGTGRFEEARTLTLDVIRKWESSEETFAPIILSVSYSNLAYIDMYTCTVTHKYDAPMYIKKSVEYFKLMPRPLRASVGPFSVPDIRSYACLVGEGADLSEFDQFLDAAKQAALYISETHHNMYYGYDDLVACEIAYYKNQLDLAKKHAHQGIIKAREKKQYSIEAMAEQYLLRIAMHSGDYPLVKEILKQLRSYLDIPNFWNRQLLYDLYTGLFYSLIGLPEMSPSWLIMDEKEANSEVHIPIAELVVSVSNYMALKKYDRALTVLSNSYPREPRHRFLFSELYFSLTAAAAKVKINDVYGAMEDFKQAYRLSFNGVFEMFFIEMGKNLHPLITAALNEADCDIPEEWLRKIDRKASVYAKKTSVIMNAFNKEKNVKSVVQLSEREQEVLTDLYHGLSREEIAANRYLSINTVKKILQSIYIKLDANNSVDAVRIAIEKKLVE